MFCISCFEKNGLSRKWENFDHIFSQSFEKKIRSKEAAPILHNKLSSSTLLLNLANTSIVPPHQIKAKSMHIVRALSTTSKVSVVQGSSRGLGLEFVRQLLSQHNHTVLATCRAPASADHLLQLQQHYGPNRLHIIQLDTSNEQTIIKAAEYASEALSHADYLFNVSGVLHLPGTMMPETSLQKITMENLTTCMVTNALGPILVCKHFVNLLARSTHATPESPSMIVNLSARVGSIGDNRLGGWYSYRSSKAALNQLTKTMSLELERKKLNIASILIHPGTVDTDLSKPFQRNVSSEKLFTKERAISQILDIAFSRTMQDNGKYLAWDGSEIIW